MSTILVTGASGFIGKALCADLARHHDVIAMSRSRPDVDGTWIQGNFASSEDLRQLDSYDIDGVVHLAAVTGGCAERDGILVNVEGTRCLMRYLMDRGCRKFVLASSIAVVGMQNVAFRPVQLPMRDEHPCLDRDGYGVSKYLMEEVTKYYQRQNPDIDVINLRLASIVPDDGLPALVVPHPIHPWAAGSISIMALSDAVRVFTMAVESDYQPGVRIMNATAPEAWVGVPTIEVLREWWGDDVDLSYYEQPGNEYAPVYDVQHIKAELGFVAKVLPKR